MPVRVSTRNRTMLPKRPPPNSDRYTPVPMPPGMPTTQERRSKTAEPTIALPMPPPSPTGRGGSTRNLKLSALIPRIAMYERMMTSVLIATKVHNAVNDVITALVARRERSMAERFLILWRKSSCVRANQQFALNRHSDSGRPARDPPNEHACDGVHDKGHKEKNQSQFNQRTQVNIG